jgi:hypothetical protein
MRRWWWSVVKAAAENIRLQTWQSAMSTSFEFVTLEARREAAAADVSVFDKKPSRAEEGRAAECWAEV